MTGRRSVLLLGLLLACESAPSHPPTAAAPGAGPLATAAYVADTDLYATQLGVTGAALRTRYRELSDRCLVMDDEVFRFHQRLAAKTYDVKGSLEAIPALCDEAIAAGQRIGRSR